jgi:hypothetical protein
MASNCVSKIYLQIIPITSAIDWKWQNKVLLCPYAVEVWRAVKSTFHVHLRRKYFVTPKAWVLDFLKRSSDREVVALAVTVWHLWEARNGLRNDVKIKDYIELILLHLDKASTTHRRETPPISP